MNLISNQCKKKKFIYIIKLLKYWWYSNLVNLENSFFSFIWLQSNCIVKIYLLIYANDLQIKGKSWFDGSNQDRLKRS